MYRGFHKYAGPLGLLLLCGGCVQMTRHSNMVVFGTNTSLGIRVGTSATSVPEIQVGYSRQEAVVMPIVANTSGRMASDGRTDLLEPCDLTQPVTVTGGAQFAVHPCSLVAINGSAVDSYSVLASFGANFDASQSTSASAKGGLAQYFATGMAAQLLALNGGASVVAVGEAARESAANPPSDGAVRSLFGNPAAYAVGQAAATTYPNFRARLDELVGALATDAEVSAKILNFETNAGINTSMRTSCATKAGCLAAIRADDYGQTYNRNKAQMETAIGRW